MYSIRSCIKIFMIILVFSGLLECSRINFFKKNIPDEAISRYLSAKKIYENGDFLSASGEFGSIYEEYPYFYQAGFMYGKSLFFMEKTDDSRGIFEKLYKKFPAFTDAGFWQARTLYSLGKLDEAEELLRRLLSYQHDNPEFLYMLALISLEEDRVPDAISFLKKASLFGERFALVYFQLGRLYGQLGLKSESLKELSRAKVLLSEDSNLSGSIESIEKKVSSEVYSGKR